jgi:hypothetical protein
MDARRTIDVPLMVGGLEMLQNVFPVKIFNHGHGPVISPEIQHRPEEIILMELFSTIPTVKIILDPFIFDSKRGPADFPDLGTGGGIPGGVIHRPDTASLSLDARMDRSVVLAVDRLNNRAD